MKTIGKRKEPSPTGRSSAEYLKRGAAMNEAMQKLPTGNTTFIPRSKVFRFKTLPEANRFQEECVITGIVKNKTKKTTKDGFCRPATVTDLLNLIKSLNEKGAQYILIGGYALYAHGIHRATDDIDILVPAKKETAQPIIEALMMLPGKTASELEPEWFVEGGIIRLADEFMVDLILDTCHQTYDSLKQYIEIIEVDEIPITTLKIEGLLLTKQSMNEKDVMDKRTLEIFLNRINI